MAIYLTQGNYTEQAMKGLVDNPEDRDQAVRGLMESVGAKLLQIYMTTGEYDFLVIAESDNLTEPTMSPGCWSPDQPAVLPT